MSSGISIAPLTSVDSHIILSAFIDPSFVIAKTLIQCEFNIHPEDNPDNPGISGYITSENGLQTVGMANNLTVTIPILEGLSTDFTGNTLIRVRFYFGDTLESAIIISDWSNSTPVYVSPPPPVIINAVLSSSTNDVINRLTVAVNSNPLYFLNNHLEVQYIITYNFIDSCGNMQWNVSDVINGTPTLFQNVPQILLDPIPFPITTNILMPVYVTVNTVYSFIYDLNNRYSVSFVSPTVVASIYEENSSTLLPPYYEIYTDMSSQIIDLSWNAPMTANVDAPSLYVLNVAVNDEPSFPIYDTSNSNLLHYSWNLPPRLYDTSLSSVLTFFVNTIYSDLSGTEYIETYYTSNDISLNTFAYPTEPTNLNVFADNNISSFNLAVTFENPVFIGQGSDKKLYCNVLDSSNAQIANEYLPYSSSTIYDFSFNFPSNDQPLAGTVEVYMETDNTNPIPAGPLSGPYATQTYNIPTIEQPHYEIYDESKNPLNQIIDLSWNIYNDDTFTSNFDRYELYVDISGVDISGGLIATIRNKNITYYSWNILNGYSNLINTTQFSELIFTVRYCSTEDTFFTSNPVNINTFAYSTEPRNLELRYAHLDMSDNVDIAFSFSNPSFVGQGTPESFYYTISDSSGVDVSGSVQYVPNTNYYSVNTTTSIRNGIITVFLVSENTNPTPLYLSGAASTLIYSASGLPIVESITKNPNYSITTIVTTSTLLGFNNLIIITYHLI
jgi:hypothetical protein